MRTRKDLQYVAGALALVLTCVCLLCIISFTSAAHASVGSGQQGAQTPLDVTPTDTSTPSPTVTSTPSPTGTTTPSPTVTTTPSPTSTSTPSPTVTNTPAPTVTNTVYPYPTTTATPAPSPSATRNIFPSPTSTASVGAQKSPTVAASAGASPTSTNTNILGTGTNQSSNSSATPANNASDPASSGAGSLANALPLLLIGLGVIVLFPLLFIPARILLRKQLVPIPSPKVPPSGAVPWSRTSASVQPARPFPFTQQGNNLYQQPFPPPPVVPSTNGYVGLTQNQPPFPTTPPLIPTAQAAYEGNQPGQINGPPPPDNSLAAANQPVNPVNNGTRKRLRRNALHAAGGPVASTQHMSGEFSTGMMVVSDPNLRTVLQQNSENGQITGQAPEESS